MEGHDQEMAQSVSAVLLSLKGAAGFNLEIRYNGRKSGYLRLAGRCDFGIIF